MSTSYAEDSHAKMSQSLAEELVSLGQEVDSSGMPFDLLGKSKHTRSSWRMCRDYFQATKAAISESLSLKWPTQGIATSSGEFWIRSSSEFPNAAVESSLLEVLEKTSNPRYFLSSKACEGILRRANRRGKVLPKALEDALVHQSQQSQD